MWLPPVVQQLTNHPGNLTLIYRFFTAPHPVPSLAASVRSVVSVYGVLLVGPSEVMSSYLGHTPDHLAAAVTAIVVATAVGIAVTVVGARQRNRFAAGHRWPEPGGVGGHGGGGQPGGRGRLRLSGGVGHRRAHLGADRCRHGAMVPAHRGRTVRSPP